MKKEEEILIHIEMNLNIETFWSGHERLITSCLAKLPEKVRDFVLEKCAIISIAPKWKGRFMSASLLEKDFEWLIILNCSTEYVVAHEIAHAWLKHESFTNNSKHDHQELAAERQVKKWGFKKLL